MSLLTALSGRKRTPCAAKANRTRHDGCIVQAAPLSIRSLRVIIPRLSVLDKGQLLPAPVGVPPGPQGEGDWHDRNDEPLDLRARPGQSSDRCDTGAMSEDPMARARAEVSEAGQITVLTGAGISTDSGIPDFRGPQGVWTKNPAAERTSTLADYLNDPEVRRQAWQTRLASPAWDARPNAGHRALVELERQGRLRALVTQNIDELHQRAGHDPTHVVELHGSMWRVRCWSCGQEGPMAPTLARVGGGDLDPACQRCGGILKSATISFGEALDPEVMARAEEAALACDLLLAVGSTLSVHPAAGLVPLAHRNGAAVVIVNAQSTPYDPLARAVVRASISEVLPVLVEAPG
jgi:NAD-dependent deacetylase